MTTKTQFYTHAVSTEQAAEKLLAEARVYDPRAYMHRDHDDEGGFYVVCYRWATNNTQER